MLTADARMRLGQNSASSKVFYVHVTVHHNKFLVNKTNRRTNFPFFLFVKIVTTRASLLGIPRDIYRGRTQFERCAQGSGWET